MSESGAYIMFDRCGIPALRPGHGASFRRLDHCSRWVRQVSPRCRVGYEI